MKIGRRGFLGLFGSAAVAGPQALAQAASPADLKLSAMGISNGASMIDRYGQPIVDEDRRSYAKQQLAKIVGFGKRGREMRRKQFWFESLEPDVAALRSMSLSSKIRISRRNAFERIEAAQATYWNGILNGWWD